MRIYWKGQEMLSSATSKYSINHQSYSPELPLQSLPGNTNPITDYQLALSQPVTRANDGQTHPLRSTAPLATKYCSLMESQQSDQRSNPSLGVRTTQGARGKDRPKPHQSSIPDRKPGERAFEKTALGIPTPTGFRTPKPPRRFL